MRLQSPFYRLASLALLATAGCEKQLQSVSLTRSKMSTLVTITVFDRSPAHAQKAIDAAFDRIDAVVQLLDRHQVDSEVSQLAASSQPLRVSPETWRLLTVAKAMGERTGGAFDVTVGPLCALWKECAQAKRLPTKEALGQALAKVGSEGIILDDATQTAALGKPGMTIDLGALAKGYVVDQAIAALRANGIESALVNAGGDMRMIGPRPGARGWRIGVQDPRDPDSARALLMTLEVQACAVATSGNYQRFFEIDGKRYSHIVDPRTGEPCSRVPSVTIVSRKDAMTADMWATAASVLAPQEALKLIDADDALEALLIAIDGDKVSLQPSKGFDALVVERRAE